MSGRRWCSPLATPVLLFALALVAPATSASAQEGEFPHVVGIKATVAATDPVLRQADLDLTIYTSGGSYTYTYAGFPTYGLPAIDYGDGQTLSSTTLPLAGPGSGPNGTNVYRSAVSFKHTYPAPATYTVRVGSWCCVGFRVTGKYYPTVGAATPTTSYSFNTLPSILTGNPALTYSGTTSYLFGAGRLVFSYYSILALTNTALVDLRQSVVEVPTASAAALALLGLALLGSGLWLLRR